MMPCCASNHCTQTTNTKARLLHVADMQKYNEMCKLSNGPYRALFAGQ